MNNENNNLNGTVLGNETPNNGMIPPQPPVNNDVNNLNPVGPTEPVSNPTPNISLEVPTVEPQVAQPTPSVNPNPEATNLNGGETLGGPVDNLNGVANEQVPPVDNGMGAPMQPMSNPMGGQALGQVDPNGGAQVLPDFTNPQTINPTPVQGLDIGTTPPISLEPEKEPKPKKNKLMFIIIVIALLALVGGGTYFALKYFNILPTSKVDEGDAIKIATKKIELEMGSKLPSTIDDYAEITGTNSTNCTFSTSEVDPNKAGEYEYTVTCGTTTEKGTVSIVDNTELTVLTKAVYKTKEEEVKPEEFIENAEGLTVEFVDANAVNDILQSDVGTYDVKLKVTDANKKELEVTGTLVIIENKIKGFLVCSSNPQTVEGSSATMTVSDTFGISDNGTTKNVYAGVASETHLFTLTDETEYRKYLEDYTKNKSVTINNITSKNVMFNEETLEITLSQELDNKDVITDYGNEVMQTYSSIKKHFDDTLGYACKYVLNSGS